MDEEKKQTSRDFVAFGVSDRHNSGTAWATRTGRVS